MKLYFEKFGPVQKARILRDYKTNNSRGSGFVLFKDSSSIEEVFKIKKHILKDNALTIELFRSRERDECEQNVSLNPNKNNKKIFPLKKITIINQEPDE